MKQINQKPPRQIITDKFDVLEFGKFQGKTVRAVLEVEPSYIIWLDEEKIVQFSQEILDEAFDRDMEDDEDNSWRDNIDVSD